MPDMPCIPSEPASVALWCAHLPGDAVIPTVDQGEATRIADEVNAILKAVATGSPYEAQPTAHACSWPWGLEDWQADVTDYAGWLRQEKD